MFSFYSADILIAVMFLGQHEKEVFIWFLALLFCYCYCVVCYCYCFACAHGANVLISGDLGEGGAKDQECAGQCKGLSASITASNFIF